MERFKEDKLTKYIRDKDIRYIECLNFKNVESSYFLSSAFKKNQPCFCVFPSEKQALSFMDDLFFFLNDEEKKRVLYFPPLFFKKDFFSFSERIKILYQLSFATEPLIIVTSYQSVYEKIISQETICENSQYFSLNKNFSREQIISKLVSSGYSKVLLVEETQEFAIRGDIIDIFSPLYENPLRLSFFGDLLESIRFFSPITQKKIQDISHAVIIPASEIILEKEQIICAKEKIKQRARKLNLSGNELKKIIETFENFDNLSNFITILPFLYSSYQNILDYMQKNSLFVLFDEKEILDKGSQIENQATKIEINANEQKKFYPPKNSYLFDHEEIEDKIYNKKLLSFNLIALKKKRQYEDDKIKKIKFDSFEDRDDLLLSLQKTIKDDEPFKPLIEFIEKKIQEKFKVVLAIESEARINKIQNIASLYGHEIQIKQYWLDIQKSNDNKNVFLIPKSLSAGFCLYDEQTIFINAFEIFGTRKHFKSKVVKSKKVLTLSELNENDIVVHIDYGLGRYLGLKNLSVKNIQENKGEIWGDYLLIEYKNEDKLYLPVDRMNMVHKYVGVESYKPILDKMGGKTWLAAKKSAKEEIEKVAKKLLSLYAERKIKQGFAFSHGSFDMESFEEDFPFEETPDQKKAIDAVLQDMESPSPMDRLLCGDVGFGKTEVILRAAFKAISNSKQVAILTPTTILSEQHYQGFCERFKKYPVEIACLNRFRTKKEQTQIVEGLKNGKIDIVIGTHALLQKRISFKDLALLAVDEEHRFGVKHKEMIKRLYPSVDVLSLSATPIPRTLQMSMMGIRDISLIMTPPSARQAVVSNIGEFDEAVLQEAILRELERGGQMFFVNDKIKNIWLWAEKIKKIVPQIKFEVVHGQLGEKEIEDAMIKFVRKEIDMLISTTIIESGIDIPNANTIFINNADRFGLAQIYQLRGRVGRGMEQAYAHLFISQETKISALAKKRLQVLMEHTDLSSGFKIAMNDLQIRGAGSMLNYSQSGHIAAIGYDMFMDLMEKTVSELKGEKVLEKLEPEINMNISAFIPKNYIEDVDQRIQIYKRLSKVSLLSEISEIKNEIEDRFGNIPNEAKNFLLKIMLRVLATKSGTKKLDLNDNILILNFSEEHQKNPMGITNIVKEKNCKFSFFDNCCLKAEFQNKKKKHYLVEARDLLKKIISYVN